MILDKGDIGLKWIILSAKEVQKISEYCSKHNYKNVIVFDEGVGGIGSCTYVTTQDEWLKNKECEKVDITDYESW